MKKQFLKTLKELMTKKPKGNKKLEDATAVKAEAPKKTPQAKKPAKAKAKSKK